MKRSVRVELKRAADKARLVGWQQLKGPAFLLLVSTHAHATAWVPTAKPKPFSSISSITSARAPEVAPDLAENRPAAFIARQAQRVVTSLVRRPLRILESGRPLVEVQANANRGDWLQAIYNKGFVDTSWATEMLADKRIMAEVLEREMGESARKFFPKTIGLREFLVGHHLVNKQGLISAKGEQIEEALFNEFPAGFVARPAVGVAPQESGRGLYRDTDNFVAELVRDGSPLYSPSHYRMAVRSHILDAIASGEAIVLQDDIMRAADAKYPLRRHSFQEVRVHTYEDHVVENAVPARWVQTNRLTDREIQAAENRVGEMLKSLPLEILNRQAWGVDVAVMDNGEMRIVQIITNRGLEVPWSSYLDQPRIIGAYSRLFETTYGVRFDGFSGALIRNNFANYIPFWAKRIEMAKPGWKKTVAYLPPFP